MPIASSPAGVMRSSTRAAVVLVAPDRVERAVGRVLRLSMTSSRARPRARSAPTTLVAAPPRSEPGSGSRLPSARWAAAESMIAWVSESLVIGSSLRLRGSGTIPDPLRPRAAHPEGARRVGGGRRASGLHLVEDLEVGDPARQVGKPGGDAFIAVGPAVDPPAHPAGDRGFDRLFERPRPSRARPRRRRRSGARGGYRGSRGPPRARRRSPRRSSRWRRSRPASGRRRRLCMVPKKPQASFRVGRVVEVIVVLRSASA